MVQTSSVVLASTIALFAVGTTVVALPIEERTIATREYVNDLESRFFGALIGAAVRIGTRVGMKAGSKAGRKVAGKAGKHVAKDQANNNQQNRKNRKNRRDEIEEFIARETDDSELAAREIEPELYEREIEFDELD